MSDKYSTWQAVFAQNQRATSRSRINDEEELKVHIFIVYCNALNDMRCRADPQCTFNPRYKAYLRIISNQNS